jgi:metal-responsive CopG/Arc/MetJ family transcriptional regulator
MAYENRKDRRIEYVPPLQLKKKVDQYAKGNRTEFINEAVKAYIRRIEDGTKENNSVKRLLGS